MTASENSPSDATRFLNNWMSEHVGTGSQLSDVTDLAAALASAGLIAGFDRAALEAAAGRPLEDAVKAAIKLAIEEGLL